MTIDSCNGFQTSEDNVMEIRQESRNITSCGLQLPFRARLKLEFLQAFATLGWALAFLSFAIFLNESVVNGLYGVTLASVEKQFQIRSSESGYIGAMMDIGAALTVVLSAYYGERLSKPRSIGISLLLSGIGCFVYIAPQFASTSEASILEDERGVCGNVTTADCSTSSPSRNYRFVFMFGMFLCGLGIEYPATLGIAYIDENTSQVRSSLFNGILYGIGGFGPLFGNILGAATLQVSNDHTQEITWTGAWWIGFLAVGSALLLSGIPIYLLPEKLDSREDVRKDREERGTRKHDLPQQNVWRRMTKLITSNPVYVCISMWVLMYECLVYAFATYAVKSLSELVGTSESTSGFLLGGLGVGVTVAGYVIGGVIVSKFNLNLRGIARFVFWCNIISLTFVFVLLLPCPEKEFSGVKSHESFNVSLSNTCNDECVCSTDVYLPVCDDAGVIYYSPCYAGCEIQVNKTLYTGCKCIDSSNTTSVSTDNCGEEVCEHVYAICGAMIISLFFGFVTSAPSVQATIRSVRFEERTVALSIQHIVLILCGRVLGRILFAECFNSACIISSSVCGDVGACRLYNKSALARNITILLSTAKFLGVVFAGLALFFIAKERKEEDNVANDPTRIDNKSV